MGRTKRAPKAYTILDLKWEPDGPSAHRAVTVFGAYRVGLSSTTRQALRYVADFASAVGESRNGVLCYAGTETEAREACRRHHEAALRPALRRLRRSEL